MIYDCFNFFNELDLLEIRLNTLNNVVDKFILCEATVTHTNQPKPLHYLKNKKRFAKFQDKIIHVVVDDSPDVNVPWIIINHQMSAVSRGFKISKPKPSDTILVSCVDEIPKPERILEWKDKPGKHKVFLQEFSYYYLNCFDYKLNGKWDGTRMFSYKDLLTYPGPYVARFTKPDVLIPDGGWHFSYVGNIKKIQYKLTAMAHQEYNNDKFNTPEHIKKSIAEGKDFLDHGRKFRIAEMHELPKYVADNQKKYQDLLIEKFEKEDKLYALRSPLLTVEEMIRLAVRNSRRTYWELKKYFS